VGNAAPAGLQIAAVATSPNAKARAPCRRCRSLRTGRSRETSGRNARDVPRIIEPVRSTGRSATSEIRDPPSTSVTSGAGGVSSHCERRLCPDPSSTHVAQCQVGPVSLGHDCRPSFRANLSVTTDAEDRGGHTIFSSLLAGPACGLLESNARQSRRRSGRGGRNGG